MKKKWVYTLDEVDEVLKRCNGDWEEVKLLLGGKMTGMFEMASIGLRVPYAFAITTEACKEYWRRDGELPMEVGSQLVSAMKWLEGKTGLGFGSVEKPLLVSVRSGAPVSMPGMMDTVLNVGLDDETVHGLSMRTGNKRFAYDSYRRLISMYGKVVLRQDESLFEDILSEWKDRFYLSSDQEMTADDWEMIVSLYKEALKEEKKEFPASVWITLRETVEAVFNSWNGKRAIEYRRMTGIADELGTAVGVVGMVFGNLNDNSGTGVAFTRNPVTGEKGVFGEYLFNAQGEDVVSGTRTPLLLESLGESRPELYSELLDAFEKLESHYKDMQDVEFTNEDGKLWMLQTRNGKRSAEAAVYIASELFDAGIIDKQTLVSRVSPEQVEMLLHPRFEQKELLEAERSGKVLCKGLAASPGAAVGKLSFNADDAERRGLNGENVILVRNFTRPDDVNGMKVAKGILTAEGGKTSHAAVVARQFGKPAVVGAGQLAIDEGECCIKVGEFVLGESDTVSLDGTSGKVYVGSLPMVEADYLKMHKLQRILVFADEIARSKRKFEVWANADYPKDATLARAYGALGIGLCRTEHMFLGERAKIVEGMILASSRSERIGHLNKLREFQLRDFEGLFEAMDGLPVIIRLIDPPLHEFLPTEKEMYKKLLGGGMDVEAEAETRKLLSEVEKLSESNPMMGLRGVRLSILMPEIVEMQVGAIFEAASRAVKRGIKVFPEVMIPLTGHVNELKAIQPRLSEIAKSVMEKQEVSFSYKFGTMIEVPRAAVTADEIASLAEFFSFGTNDLTQMTFGYSRDDAERNFLTMYVTDGILPINPFVTIDFMGVGELMKMAVEKGRQVRPGMEIGICGEHGGDPKSVEFCYNIGLNYVSCSPFRVPVARMAAAHAVLNEASKE